MSEFNICIENTVCKMKDINCHVREFRAGECSGIEQCINIGQRFESD